MGIISSNGIELELSHSYYSLLKKAVRSVVVEEILIPGGSKTIINLSKMVVKIKSCGISIKAES